LGRWTIITFFPVMDFLNQPTPPEKMSIIPGGEDVVDWQCPKFRPFETACILSGVVEHRIEAYNGSGLAALRFWPRASNPPFFALSSQFQAMTGARVAHQ